MVFWKDWWTKEQNAWANTCVCNVIPVCVHMTLPTITLQQNNFYIHVILNFQWHNSMCKKFFSTCLGYFINGHTCFYWEWLDKRMPPCVINPLNGLGSKWYCSCFIGTLGFRKWLPLLSEKQQPILIALYKVETFYIIQVCQALSIQHKALAAMLISVHIMNWNTNINIHKTDMKCGNLYEVTKGSANPILPCTYILHAVHPENHAYG